MKSSHWMGSILSNAPSATTDSPSVWVRLADLVLGWLERSRQRAALGRLDDRMLADIGCDPAHAQVEASKPFWKN